MQFFGMILVVETRLSSESVHDQIDQLLLSGRAKTASEAEAMFLDDHLPQLVRFAMELDERTFL
jgi:hypothetical protein